MTLARLEEVTCFVKYYKIVNLKPLASFLVCDPIIKKFKLEFDAIKKRKPKYFSMLQMSHKLDVARTEAFLDSLSRIVAAKNITLAHVVRPKNCIMTYLLS